MTKSHDAELWETILGETSIALKWSLAGDRWTASHTLESGELITAQVWTQTLPSGLELNHFIVSGEQPHHQGSGCGGSVEAERENARTMIRRYAAELAYSKALR